MPGDSYIYIEARLTPKSGAESFGDDDDIGLINNGVMYLFDRIGYKVNEKEIEGYSYPGVATTIKGILTYPKYYPQGSQFAWLQDRGKSFTNVGNKERRKLMRDGHFSVAIPLSHIFGFCEYYKKVTYGYKHTLTLRRNHDNDAIIKSDSQEEVGGETRDKVLDGSIVINKLSWHMPHVILSDESQLSLLKDISNKVSLYIPYLNRQCERLSILQNSRDLDWKLNISAGSERPRYIFLCFQEVKDNNQKVNPSNFDHLQVTNAYVQLNSERYPEENLNINFNKNHFVKPYKMAADFHKIFGDNTTFSVDQDDYKNIYPIYAFDVSKQTERLRALSHGRLFSCQLPPQKIVRNRIHAFLRKHSHEQLFCGGHKKVASSCGRAHFSDHTIVVGNSWREWKPLFSKAAFTRATFRRTTFCNFLKVTASLMVFSTGTFFLIVVSWRLMKGPTFVR